MPDRLDPRDALLHARLFATLDAVALDAVAAGATPVRIPAGGWLFHQGEPSDSLAVLVSGRLEVVDERTGDVLRVLAPSAVLGELGLLTGSTRSASVRAVRDSELVVVPQPVFDALLEGEPSFTVGLARSLAALLRVSGDLDVTPAQEHVIAFVAAGPGVRTAELAGAVATAIGQGPSTVSLLDGAAAASSGSSYGRLLEERERSHDVVVLVADGPEDTVEWRSFCLRSADRIVVLAPDAPPAPTTPTDASLVGRDLALPPGVAPAVSSGWTERLVPRARHRLGGADASAQVERLARRLTGRGVGLVLSGGGARGLAHVGVLERLHELRVPIDRVGGCSMGSLVAALHASGMSPVQMRAHLAGHLSRRRLADLRVPGAAMLRARRGTAVIERIFGSSALEELEVEAFAVSADLVSGEVVVHRDGSVRDAVVASMAVPGLFPAVRRDGRVLVDGGVLDNLPVDVMAATERGPVIAVDVMRRTGDLPRAGAVDTVVRSMVLGGWQRVERNRELADVVVAPDVAGIGFLDFDRADEAIAAGRRAVDAAVPDLERAGLLR